MGRRIAFLVWRDTAHPDGGGSEVFVEHVARWLAEHGDDVTIVCAAHAGAPRSQLRDGVQFVRGGGRCGVYVHGLRYLLSRAGRQVDVVIDVQNGLPFWSPLVRRRKPIVVLVHHCHREQWRILFPGVVGRVGSWLETRVAPRVYRGRPYITVSQASRSDLVAQGVQPENVQVVVNGVDEPRIHGVGPAPVPTLCVLGRLVPHKRVEDALTAVAALRLELPGVRLEVVGDGWWADQLKGRAAELGISDAVTFHGYLPADARDEIVAASWVLLVPSIKEGWGIAIMEAAALGVPAIGYRDAGGVAEAIVDRETGLIVDDVTDLTKMTGSLLTDDDLRTRLAAAARDRATTFDWRATGAAFAAALPSVR